MSWQDFVTISPLVAAILTAVGDPRRRPRSGPGAAAVAVGDGADRAGDHARPLDPRSSGATPASAFGGAYRVDALTTFLDLLFIAIIALTIVFAPGLPRAARPAGRRVRDRSSSSR